jgi:hypothetical protein
VDILRHALCLCVAMLFLVFGINLAIAVPVSASGISFYQSEKIFLTTADDVGFAARAPPLTVSNVEVTGGANVIQGRAFALHGQETVAALLGFGADHNATNTGVDDLIPGGTRRSADDVNGTFPDEYSPPYTPGTQVTEFVSDGNQTFVRVVSGDSPGGQWAMKASDIEGLSPQQIADKFALPEVPTGITSVTPPAGTRIRTGEVIPNFGDAGGGTQFQLLDRVNDGWADVTPLQ